MNQVLTIDKLSYSYGSTEALCDVSFEVSGGDYVGLAGPNGAGKTTLIKTALGLIDNYSGSVKLFNTERYSFSNWHKVGYLPQRANYFNPLFPATVREVAALGLLSTKSFPKSFTKNDRAKIETALESMGIANLGDKLIGNLSGGQQQRAFLARALAAEPELLILDEPSTALDPVSREGFYDLINDLNKKRGITIILITHDTSQIGRYANKLLYLDKKVIFYGPFADFCKSEEMTNYFGKFSQHLICHQH